MAKYLSDIQVNILRTHFIADTGGTTRIILATTADPGPQVTLTDYVTIGKHLAIRGLVPSATIGVHLGDIAGLTANSFTVIDAGFKLTPAGNNGNLIGLKAANMQLTAADSSTGHSVAGMNFTAVVTGGGGTSAVTSITGAQIRTGAIAYTGTITTTRGVYVVSNLLQFGTPVVTTAIGVDIENQGHSSSTDVYGVMVRAITAGTNRYGIYINAISGGTINVGLLNAAPTVFTPTTAQTLAAGTAILANATVVQIDSVGNVTSTAAPTIADGQNGQLLIIINTDTADTITLSDQGTLASSNLRLSAATIALAPRDNLILVYNSAIGDWVQVGTTNVI